MLGNVYLAKYPTQIQCFSFQNEIKYFLDTLSQKIFFQTMKINYFGVIWPIFRLEKKYCSGYATRLDGGGIVCHKSMYVLNPVNFPTRVPYIVYISISHCDFNVFSCPVTQWVCNILEISGSAFMGVWVLCASSFGRGLSRSSSKKQCYSASPIPFQIPDTLYQKEPTW